MHVKTESGMILNWSAISRIETKETHTNVSTDDSLLPPSIFARYEILAYLANVDKPITVAIGDKQYITKLSHQLDDGLQIGDLSAFNRTINEQRMIRDIAKGNYGE